MQVELTSPHPWKDFVLESVCDSVQEFWQGIIDKAWLVTAEYHYADEVRTDSINVRGRDAIQASERGCIHFNTKQYRGVRVTKVRLSDPIKDMGLINV